ncbi:MAG TPA: hypothetical protein V6D19_23725 [Stenomitos sp.]
MTSPPPLSYQAIAKLQGRIDLDVKPNTLTGGDAVFPALISGHARKKLVPGESQTFLVYPRFWHSQLAFEVRKVVNCPPTPIVLNGCWELSQDLPFFIIYRNELKHPTDRKLQSLNPVVWEDAPPADGQFWKAIGELRDGAIQIIQADGPFEPPPKATRFGHKTQKPSKAAIAPVEVASEPNPVEPLTREEIYAMATPAKVQLTCKLNQVPKHRTLPDKQVEFFLRDGESERIFTVRMKPKVFKKLTDHGYADWVAAISGEIGAATETGFELVNPSLQVFAKKSKGDADAVTPAYTEPQESATPAKAESKESKAVGQRKSLLDGVKLR